MRQIILDTETTGFNAKKERIIEFAAIELINGKLTGNNLHLYFNPEQEISEQSFSIHHLSLAELQHSPTFAECIGLISDFCFDATWIAHNAQFDISFLKEEYLRCGEELVVPESNIICTQKLARNKLNKGDKLSLDALCDRFYINRSKRDVGHGAMLDCELLYEVYKNLQRL